jgi:hypothetical protein
MQKERREWSLRVIFRRNKRKANEGEKLTQTPFKDGQLP